MRGGGAWINDERVRIGDPASLAQAQVSFGNLKSLAANPPRWQKLAALVTGAERTRGYGDFYHYHLLARGAVDAVVESDVGILDIAALYVIVTEAGGIFTDLDGVPVDLRTRSVLASTPALHPELKAVLQV